jgi:hypothetical protein
MPYDLSILGKPNNLFPTVDPGPEDLYFAPEDEKQSVYRPSFYDKLLPFFTVDLLFLAAELCYRPGTQISFDQTLMVLTGIAGNPGPIRCFSGFAYGCGCWYHGVPFMGDLKTIWKDRLRPVRL